MTLPPLPTPARSVVYNESKGYGFDAFTADQLRDYARAAIAAHVPEAAFGNIAAVHAQPLTDEQIHESLCEACSDGSGPVSLAEFRQDEAFSDMVAFTRALERRIAAAPQAVPVPAWQPIETAPKDGKPLLIWCDTDDGGEPMTMYRDCEGRWLFDGEPTFCASFYLNPTHWMPLPAAPKEQP